MFKKRAMGLWCCVGSKLFYLKCSHPEARVKGEGKHL